MGQNSWEFLGIVALGRALRDGQREFQWDLPGIPLGFSFGILAGFSWDFFGIFGGFSFGIPWEFLWDFLVEFLWDFPLGIFLWNFPGGFLEDFPVEFLWDFPWELLEDSLGILLGILVYSCGISLEFSGDFPFGIFLRNSGGFLWDFPLGFLVFLGDFSL